MWSKKEASRFDDARGFGKVGLVVFDVLDRFERDEHVILAIRNRETGGVRDLESKSTLVAAVMRLGNGVRGNVVAIYSLCAPAQEQPRAVSDATSGISDARSPTTMSRRPGIARQVLVT